MKLAVSGRVKVIETGLGVANVVVEAFDANLIHHDLLGKTVTDQDGAFAITLSDGYETGSVPTFWGPTRRPCEP